MTASMPQKLAELLRGGFLRPVYHGGPTNVAGAGRSYLTISRDLTRVMNRLKALYRGWGIPCAGTQVYAPRHRLLIGTMVGNSATVTACSVSEAEPAHHDCWITQGKKLISSFGTEKPTGIARPSRGLDAAKIVSGSLLRDKCLSLDISSYRTVRERDLSGTGRPNP